MKWEMLQNEVLYWLVISWFSLNKPKPVWRSSRASLNYLRNAKYLCLLNRLFDHLSMVLLYTSGVTWFLTIPALSFNLNQSRKRFGSACGATTGEKVSLVIFVLLGFFPYWWRNARFRLTLRTLSWIITSASPQTISHPSWRSTLETWAAPGAGAEGAGGAGAVAAGPAVGAGLTRWVPAAWTAAELPFSCCQDFYTGSFRCLSSGAVDLTTDIAF